MSVARWKAILASPPNSTAFFGTLEAGFPKLLKTSQGDFENFVGPWRDSPEIILKRKRTRQKLSVFTGVESSWSKGKRAKPEDILMFLARGTSVRYATMPFDFSPKTSYRVINSGPGGGGRDPLYVNTSEPKPGISARDIEEAVYDKRKIEIIREAKKLFGDAIKAL